MNKTKIEWTDYTLNIITGCKNNCKFCYARKIANRFKNVFPNGFNPTFHPERLKEPEKLRKPAKIFLNSMGETFGRWVPDEWVTAIFNMIWRYHANMLPEHQFQILTKCPQNIPYFSAIISQDYRIPPNLWLGVSINYQRDVWRKEALLRSVKRKTGVFFISFEPLLEEIKINLDGIDWIIIGSQTNPLKIPRKRWVLKLIKQARDLNIPVFLKNNLFWYKKIQEYPIRKGE